MDRLVIILIGLRRDRVQLVDMGDYSMRSYKCLSVGQDNSTGRVCTCDALAATFLPEVRIYHDISIIRSTFILRSCSEVVYISWGKVLGIILLKFWNDLFRYFIRNSTVRINKVALYSIPLIRFNWNFVWFIWYLYGALQNAKNPDQLWRTFVW